MRFYKPLFCRTFVTVLGQSPGAAQGRGSAAERDGGRAGPPREPAPVMPAQGRIATAAGRSHSCERPAAVAVASRKRRRRPTPGRSGGQPAEGEPEVMAAGVVQECSVRR